MREADGCQSMREVAQTLHSIYFSPGCPKVSHAEADKPHGSAALTEWEGRQLARQLLQKLEMQLLNYRVPHARGDGVGVMKDLKAWPTIQVCLSCICPFTMHHFAFCQQPSGCNPPCSHRCVAWPSVLAVVLDVQHSLYACVSFLHVIDMSGSLHIGPSACARWCTSYIHCSGDI